MLIYIGPILGFIGFLVGLKLTGMASRSYVVLDANTEVNGKQVIDILEKYKPIIYQTDDIKMDIEFFFYEFVEKKDKLVLIYRPLWKDEIHPIPIIHNLYKYFRMIFYGSVKDIEFVEIFVDKLTGDILSFSFENLTEGSPIEAPEHMFTDIVKKGKKFYNKTKNDEIVIVPFENSRVILQVKTWNHLLCINENPQGQKYDRPLKPLTNWDYRKYSITRRSSGHIKTKLIKWLDLTVSFSLMLILGVGIPLLLFFLL